MINTREFKMSDWDFLHDMMDMGYSPEEISNAAACGYNCYEETLDLEDDDSE